MLEFLDSTDAIAFNTYHDNGFPAGMINRKMVYKLIDLGYEFDVTHIPQSIVDEVCSFDFSNTSLGGNKKRMYKSVGRHETIKFVHRD